MAVSHADLMLHRFLMTAGSTFSITPATKAPTASPTAAPTKGTAKSGAALTTLLKQLEVRSISASCDGKGSKCDYPGRTSDSRRRAPAGNTITRILLLFMITFPDTMAAQQHRNNVCAAVWRAARLLLQDAKKRLEQQAREQAEKLRVEKLKQQQAKGKGRGRR